MPVDMVGALRLLGVIVGLKRVGNLNSVRSDHVLAGTWRPEDRLTVLEMASVVERLLEEFDHENSPEFLSKLVGKSDQLRGRSSCFRLKRKGGRPNYLVGR
jgi:hypothetical protein